MTDVKDRLRKVWSGRAWRGTLCRQKHRRYGGTTMAYYDDIVYYLTDGYWEWAGLTRRKFDVAPGGTLTVNLSALQGDAKGFAGLALHSWSIITGINFESVEHNNADIMFSDDRPGASNRSTVADGLIIQSVVNVSTEWVEQGEGLDTLQTFIHEIGHALGLGHPGPYNGDRPENFFAETISYYDSNQISVMSYIDQTENLIVRGDYAFVMTPMIADILAIHELYGAPASVYSGNTMYGVNANTGTFLDVLFDIWMEGQQPFGVPLSLTLYDTDGNDSLNFTTGLENQIIDLNPGSASSIYGVENNLFIAADTIIENAYAGYGNDVIVGNDANNKLHGGYGGNDVIFGDEGNDLIWGKSGDDWLRGDRGNDVLVGGAGNDFLVGGLGNDRFYFTKDGIYTTDTIFDFKRGEDKIDLRKFESIDSVSDFPWYHHGEYDARLDLTGHGGGQIILVDYREYGESYIYEEDFIFADDVMVA